MTRISTSHSYFFLSSPPSCGRLPSGESISFTGSKILFPKLCGSSLEVATNPEVLSLWSLPHPEFNRYCPISRVKVPHMPQTLTALHTKKPLRLLWKESIILLYSSVHFPQAFQTAERREEDLNFSVLERKGRGPWCSEPALS